MSFVDTKHQAYVSLANAQGYGDATPLATVKNRISALITNLVALGFGG